MTPHRDRLLAGDYEGAGATAPDLASMTKAELLEHAQQLGLDVSDAMTKAEIRDAIDAGA